MTLPPQARDFSSYWKFRAVWSSSVLSLLLSSSSGEKTRMLLGLSWRTLSRNLPAASIQLSSRFFSTAKGCQFDRATLALASLPGLIQPNFFESSLGSPARIWLLGIPSGTRSWIR